MKPSHVGWVGWLAAVVVLIYATLAGLRTMADYDVW